MLRGRNSKMANSNREFRKIPSLNYLFEVSSDGRIVRNVKSKNQCKIVSGFGMRYHPILHYRRMHTGIDLTAQLGTPVYATGDGTIQVAGRGAELGGYGIAVVVNHGYGFKTLYGHLSDVSVVPGQRVKRGDMIGKVGRSGLSTGYHLHYEVIQNGAKVNPVYFFFNDLSPEEYDEVLETARLENQCLS